MVTTRAIKGKKLLGEMHDNSITIKDFVVQFSRKSFNGKVIVHMCLLTEEMMS